MFNLTQERVIFSIDNPWNTHENMRFHRHISRAKAMGRISTPVACIGSYKGTLEPSWMVTRGDFDAYIRDTSYVYGQESFLHLPGSPIENCWLSFPEDNSTLTLEPMKLVYIQPQSDAWTYFMEQGVYGIC